MAGVLGRDDSRGGRPVDREGRIIPANPALMARIVELRNLVKDFGMVSEGQIAVRETLGNIKCAMVLGREVKPRPGAISGRRRPQIDNDVMDRAADTAYQLDFGKRIDRVMHPAQGSRRAIERGIALGNRRVESMRFKFPTAKGPCEESATVLGTLKLNHKGSAEFRLSKVHATGFSAFPCP